VFFARNYNGQPALTDAMQIKIALVVDDSKSARFSLKKLLEKQGIQTDFAESAGDALNYLETHQPDVIFMDHLMPGMDGFDATKAIKKMGAKADIPIIMCTSKDGSDYAEQAMAVGAYAILPKPAPEATLLAVLNQLAQAAAAPASDAGADSKPAAANTGMNQRAIELLVKKMLDEQVGVLRKQITETLQAQLREHVEQTLADVRGTVKRELTDSMDANINAVAQRHARQIAIDLFDQRFDELTQRIQGPLQSRFAEVDAAIDALRKPSPEFVSEIKTMAQFTAAAAAGEAAKATAADTSQRVAEEAAKRELASVKAALARDTAASIAQGTQQVRLIAIGGIVLAIAALAAAFLV
jgi:CheY-like chemotaxis protein